MDTMHGAQEKERTARRITAFDGIRGLAALHIVGGHFATKFVALLPPLRHCAWLIRPGNYSVTTFFLLSGFILTMTYDRKVDRFGWPAFAGFIRSRVLRLYPAYGAALLALVVMVLGAELLGVPYHRFRFPWAELPAEFLMVHLWWPTNFLGWNYPAWSVSILLAVSLFLFPPLFNYLRQERREGILMLWLAIMLGAYLVIRVHTQWGWYWRISRVVFPFTSGALIYTLWRKQPAPSLYLANAAAAVGLCAYFLPLYFTPTLGFAATASILSGIVLTTLAVTWPATFLARFMSWRWFTALGLASYSIYLSHALAEKLIVTLLPPAHYAGGPLGLRLLLLLTYVLLTVLFAAALYWLVERPCENLRHVRRP